MEFETIVRKDGIVYERKKRPNCFDCHLNIKFYRKDIEKLKVIANDEGINYNTLVRNILNSYIENHSN